MCRCITFKTCLIEYFPFTQKIVNNQTLGYYLARTALFLWAVGVHKEKVRFRQHLGNEMAHYASDCWDAEILTSYVRIHTLAHAHTHAHNTSTISVGGGCAQGEGTTTEILTSFVRIHTLTQHTQARELLLNLCILAC